jgi:anaerobic selenocysteine-containing dehydrogenase
MSSGRSSDVWGERTPIAAGAEWPVRVDEHVVEQPERWVQSACVLCSNGCGMDIGVKAGRIVGVRGRGEDRVNRGRLGPKGLYGWKANNSPDRLIRPLIRRDGQLQEASWDEAMESIVSRSHELLETMGPLSLGLYTYGQLF